MQLNYKKNVQMNKKKRKSEKDRGSEAPERRSKSRKESGDEVAAEGNPAGAKAVLAAMGMMRDVLRLPLVAASEALTGQVAAHMAARGHVAARSEA